MMSNNNSAIVTKVWSFCNTLRDDGVGDYGKTVLGMVNGFSFRND